MKFTTAIINKEGKWFVAKSAELGVASQGKTIEEAKRNLQEAVELYLDHTPLRKKDLITEHPLVTSVQIRRA